MTSTTATDSQAGERRRPGARAKRGQVMDAAVELFLANGYDQTSMDAIAAHAGVSKTTVYAHYADKLALFKAVVERSSRSLALQIDESHLAEEQDPQTRLRRIVLVVLEATTTPEFRAFQRVMVSESTRHPDLAFAAEAAGVVDVIEIIASALEDEAEQCGYRLTNPRVHATVLMRMAVSGPQLDSLLFAKFQPDHALLEAHVRMVTDIFLRGIEPWEGESRDVAPTAEAYGYPWLPDLGTELPR